MSDDRYAPVDRNWIEVVLDGGPCSGKSTSLARLVEELGEHDVRVLCVPEIPTMLMNGGVGHMAQIAVGNRPQYLDLQQQMLLLHQSFRERYRRIAEGFFPQRVAIVYDRAAQSAAAFCEDDEWAAILSELQLNLHDVRDSYDLVLHLVTAAIGAEDAYTTDNNAARTETPEQAAASDRRTLRVWTGSPHLHIVDNRGDFEHKLSRVVDLVRNAVGLPGVEIERKWLLADAPDVEVLDRAVAIDIEQTYLRTEVGERRVRRRSQGASTTWFLTEKVGEGISRVERERVVSPREALALLAEADPERSPIRKTRYCLAHEGHHVEIDRVEIDGGPLWLLEIELLTVDEEFRLPPVNVLAEVTEHSMFKNASIARDPAAALAERNRLAA